MAEKYKIAGKVVNEWKGRLLSFHYTLHKQIPSEQFS